ncbi:MAG: DUF4325 domain-containing protein [Patescibacteria group bacterium]
MDIKNLITNRIEEKGEARVVDIVEETSFSRKYIHRFFDELQKEGKITKIGTTKVARYVFSNPKDIAQAKKGITKIDLPIKNTGLNEDVIEDKIREETGIFFDLTKNVKGIVNFAFLEMLNNAIEHSKSKSIRVTMSRFENKLIFDIFDSGIGVFVSIMKKKGLKSDLEAIQDLLKGKETTEPESHTGQGIFFTARIADKFIIYSSKKKLIFDNEIGDVFLKDSPVRKGTRVHFEIALNSKKKTEDVFKKYTEKGSYEFSKTEVIIRLYKMDVGYISRSQARRVTVGLEKFKSVLLDFDKVDTVGQGFADEVFRVWQKRNPETKLTYKNANENVLFMIERALSGFQEK